MNAPDHADDAPAAHGGPASSPTPGSTRDGDREREDEERCLAVLLLLHDGRAVEPEVAAWAHAHLAAHASCAAAFAELVEQSAALAAAPVRHARPEFTERVLAELFPVAKERGGRADGGRADVVPFVRRLAVAAGLALALSLFAQLARPVAVQADAALQRQRHAADHFRPDAFGPQDIEAGLRARLRDPEFGAHASGLPPRNTQPGVTPPDNTPPKGGGR